MPEYIRIHCLRIVQPIGEFYIGVIGAKDLFEISAADIRRIKRRDVEEFLGIQRPLLSNRVDEIKRYVNGIDATFPTGVILAIDSNNAKYDHKKTQLTIKREKKVGKIIDGQHRIAGLEGVSNDTFQVNVVIFIDMELEDQAMVFATINLAQTKVNRSLAYDLFEFTKNRSPQKTSHNIARLLNRTKESPFSKRIKILGTADPEYRETQILTQATFVESMIRLISGGSKKAEEDRELLKRKMPLTRPTERESKKLIFRNRFIDEKDAEITTIVWNYFESISKKWPRAWSDLKRGGSILPRTNGFRAMMRLLPDVYTVLEYPLVIPTVSEFLQVLKRIQLRDEMLTSDKYKPGTSGEAQLLRDLQRSIL